MPDVKVFVSVGRTSTPDQEAFVAGLEAHMQASGLTPLALGRNYYSSQQPLRAIDELMSQCAGAAIVAFERLHILQAVDRRGSTAERPVAGVSLPTVWNQIEAAMAYVRGLPLLVLVQEELRTEGLLETGYDWYVKRLPLDAGATRDREFRGVFDDWQARVREWQLRRSLSPAAPVTTGSSPLEASRTESSSVGRKELRRLLETRFNDDELRGLCFDLEVDYENLPGATHAARAMAIIAYFERMNRYDELMRTVRELRPDPL